MRASRTRWLAWCLALAACSEAGSESEFGATGGGAGSGGGGSGSGGGSGGALIDAAIGDADPTAACPDEAKYVYVITDGGNLQRFDPPSLTFLPVGTINCPNAGFGSPFSMSVDRKGTAWVVFTNGKLFHVSTKDASCTSTPFVPNQYGFTTFGMGFSSNAPGTAEETLFVTQSDLFASITGLAMIDTNTLELHPINGYDTLDARAEMTGTGDARLFGAFEGTPYVVAELNKQTAQVMSQAPQSAINYPPGSSNFAFAFWGGDFWLFVGPGSSTDVFQYKPSDGSTTLAKHISDAIVGAGVSTCAPLKPPA